MTLFKASLMTLLAGLIMIAIPAFAESLYVRSFRISLHEAPQHDSPKIASLKRGEQVKPLRKQKNWTMVRHQDREGWVNQLALSSKPPRKRVSLFKKEIDISSSARKRASTFTSAAAARGLMDSGREKLEIKGGPDFEAVARMEGVEVDVKQAIAFINEDE